MAQGLVVDAVTDGTLARAVSMGEAVGYPALPCEHETPVTGALVLKHDRCFLLVDKRGNVAPAGRCSLGLFQDDTRILSHYELSTAGGPLSVLSAQVVQPYHAEV